MAVKAKEFRYAIGLDRAGRVTAEWPTDAPIDWSEHELADWELLTDALVGALGRQGVMNVDQLRRGIESMPPDEYERGSYYERWLAMFRDDRVRGSDSDVVGLPVVISRESVGAPSFPFGCRG